MKTLNDVTLYDLMSEDLDVWVSKNKSFGINLEIDAEDGEILISEEGVHPFAADSFADFCRRYLNSYARLQERENTHV